MEIFFVKPAKKEESTLDLAQELVKRVSKATGDTIFLLGLAQVNGYVYYTVGAERKYVDSVKLAVRSIFPKTSFESTSIYDYENSSFVDAVNYSEINLSKQSKVPLNISKDLSTDTVDYLIELFQEYSKYSSFLALELWILPVGTTSKEKISMVAESIAPPAKDEDLRSLYESKQKSKKFHFYSRVVFRFEKKEHHEMFEIDLNSYLKLFTKKDCNSLDLEEVVRSSPRIPARRQLKKNLSVKEIASIIHFPYKVRSGSKLMVSMEKSLPVPKEVALVSRDEKTTIFGMGTVRGRQEYIGIKPEDRNTHTYIVGKTGTGKTKLLELLMKSDIEKGRGVIFLDPHGDTARNILRYVPKERVDDCIYADFPAEDFVTCFNPIEFSQYGKYNELVIEDFIEVMKGSLGADWNPRMEFLMRQVLSALSYMPNCTVAQIPVLLTDPEFRQSLIERIEDGSVRNFWAIEYPKYRERYENEALSPLINRIAQMLTNPRVKRTISLPESTIKIEEAIKERKILIVNLSIGELGEFNSSFLGSMIISRILQVMFKQAELPPEKRVQANLYVDEFQNFSTESFIRILSEARKYRLALTIAHQYLAQIPLLIRSSILGNVGSIMSFRLGQSDANIIQEEFKPHLQPEDFVQLGVREFWAKISVDGKVSLPFSGVTIMMEEPEVDYSDRIIQNFMKRYSLLASDVDKRIEGKVSFESTKEINTFGEPVAEE